MKLTAALAAADRTNQGLNRMQDLLGGMQGSLRTMEANIGRMTQKIVHAVLLF
jgi:hypothetical protein